MSFLPDKNNKRKRLLLTVGGVFLLLIMIFETSLVRALGNPVSFITTPLFKFGDAAGNVWETVAVNFQTKVALQKENDGLKQSLAAAAAQVLDRNSIFNENAGLKEMLGRTDKQATLMLAVIIAKPNRSPYDTLVLDVGENDGVHIGANVYADNAVLIGRITDVTSNSSKVKLFSTSGETTTVRLDNTNADVDIMGFGGGDFELSAPRDMAIPDGTQAFIPGLHPELVAIVEKSIADTRDPTQKILLTSPINMQALRYVEIEK